MECVTGRICLPSLLALPLSSATATASKRHQTLLCGVLALSCSASMVAAAPRVAIGTEPDQTKSCSAPPPSDSRTVHCPAGQAGAIAQTRSYSCRDGGWVAGNWATTGNTCGMPPSGCATHYRSGSYACSGTCGVAGATLAVTPGSVTMIADPFGANGNVVIACAGATGQPQSTNLVILGSPGYICGLHASGTASFGLACRNMSGSTCASTCSK